MPNARFLRRILALFFLAALANPTSKADNADNDTAFRPVSSAELAMKSIPDVPGAVAVTLYREERSDDSAGTRYVYLRRKILRPEGMKYADIEVPYLDGVTSITDLRARTIRPDGSSVQFTGQPFDKMIVKAKGVKIMAKTWTMPEAGVGSIVEYHYVYHLRKGFIYDTRWDLQDELYTLHGKFHLTPYLGPLQTFGGGTTRISYRYSKIPTQESVPRRAANGDVDVDIMDMMPLPTEDYMPPRDGLGAQVRFFYGGNELRSPEEYWSLVAQGLGKYTEDYIGHRGAIQSAARAIVSDSDPPEVKARKLYMRVQSLRNLSFERERTEQEEKAANLKEAKNIEDVWKNGYGYANELTMLYAGLARAVGLDARILRVAERDDTTFDRELPSYRQLAGTIVLLNLNGKDIYLDPGMKYCPFGLLTWYRTGVTALLLDSKSRTTFLKTPDPEGADSAIERTANLVLDRDGTLHGEMVVRFNGLAGSGWRTQEREEDDAGRIKDLETEAKGWFPVESTVKVTSVNSWDTSSEPLEVHLTITIPSFATPTGKRLLMSRSIFQGKEEYFFGDSRRQNPLALHYPFQHVDKVTIKLPTGLKVESLPAPRSENNEIAKFATTLRGESDTLQLERTLGVSRYYYSLVDYERLRAFLVRVKGSDDEQVVLSDAK